jgi:peptidyl-prolyl cis-trans isomerase SurA
MKRCIVLAVVAAIACSSAWAQALDKPAATVRLTKTESISVKQLQKAVAPYEAQLKRVMTKDERKLVLDRLVATILISQAAERDKVTVSDADIKAEIAGTEKQLGLAANLGRDMTDVELQQYLKNNGSTWEDFQKGIKDNLLLVAYANFKRKGFLDAVKGPSDDDARDFYDANKASYFQDDMITLRHIFIDTRQLTAKEDRDKAAKRADDIAKELKGGGVFGDLVIKYSDDTASKYKQGDIGTLVRSDAQRKQLFGNSFFDAVFRLKKGETSGVLASNIGYHIIQVVAKYDARLLGIDDKVPPLLQVSVRDSIKANLLVQRKTDALASALNDIVAELKKQAEVKPFDDNITW